MLRSLQSDYDDFSDYIEKMMERHPDNRNFVELYKKLIDARMKYEESRDAAEIALKAKIQEFEAQARRERLKQRLESRPQSRM